MKRADVRLETGEAKIVFDDTKQTPSSLAAAVDKLGFQASVHAVTAAPKPTLYVEGLKDTKAVRQVESTLKGVKGVKGVMVDPGLGEVFVEYDDHAVNPRELVAALETAGFKARVASP
ncbi:MAG: heavy-metal-associated domain-containing protein [Candidatus Rokubacteria bacterium]|nr:heavy-metal-associated domain-containing protein [Candidatus Rokubacteria bacterium]